MCATEVGAAILNYRCISLTLFTFCFGLFSILNHCQPVFRSFSYRLFIVFANSLIESGYRVALGEILEFSSAAILAVLNVFAVRWARH